MTTSGKKRGKAAENIVARNAKYELLGDDTVTTWDGRAGLQAALCSARAQLEYLDGERTTGTTACVLAQIDAALSELEKSK